MSGHQSFWVSVYLCGAFLLIPPSVDRHPHGFNLHRAPAELAHLQSPTSLTARLHDDISLQGYMRFFHPVPLRQKPETSCRFKDEFIYSVSPNAFPSSNPSLLIPLNAVTISEGFPFMVPPPHLTCCLLLWMRLGKEGKKDRWSDLSAASFCSTNFHWRPPDLHSFPLCPAKSVLIRSVHLLFSIVHTDEQWVQSFEVINDGGVSQDMWTISKLKSVL